jgi:drug/metabolite transporter (DMT)-like permease
MANLKDYVHLNFIVIIWGFTATLGLLISIPAVEIVFYRTLIASIAIAVMIQVTGHHSKASSGQIIKMLLTGGIIGVHWVLFFASARIANASISLIGLATVALWTSILEPLANRRKIKLFEVLLGLIIIGGLYIIYNVNLSYKLGLTMAVFSGMAAATFSVINGKFAHRHHHFTITLYEMMGACLSIFLFIPIYTQYFSDTGAFEWRLSLNDFLYLLVLSLVCTVYAFSASVELLKRISVFASNLFIHMEPIYGIILAVLIFKESEQMNAQFYIGTTVIVLAVLSYPMVKFYQKRRKPARL